MENSNAFSFSYAEFLYDILKHDRTLSRQSRYVPINCLSFPTNTSVLNSTMGDEEKRKLSLWMLIITMRTTILFKKSRDCKEQANKLIRR